MAPLPKTDEPFLVSMFAQISDDIESPIKMANPTRNLQVGDIVCLRDKPTSPTKWPIARVVEIHPGKDGRVRVVTVRTP